MTMPTVDNIPELDFNFEGLRRHSFLCMFVGKSAQSLEHRKLRGWLLHTLITATKHYSKARELVQLQTSASQSLDGGYVFHVLDLSGEVENCISATYRACMAIKRMGSNDEGCRTFIDEQKDAFEKLSRIRNQFEHMHSQIVSGEVGDGPISITMEEHGKIIRFRGLRMKTTSLHTLIRESYFTIATLYPEFNANSKPEAGGPLKLTITTSVSFKTKPE